MADKIKLKRTLYVGIGGTGVDTLLKVKENFIDIYGEVPPMIGFLAIDTDKATNGKSLKSSLGETIRLEQSETLVCSVKGALSIYNINSTKFDWVPRKNVNALSGISGGGAGQVRSNGRFIALFNQKKIENAIGAAITNITKLIPIESKFAVDKNEDGVERPVYINVVASIAGGTGSGMLIDVLYIIRESLKNTNEIRLFPWIVLPEIFRAMASGPAMANVLYNSYGALRTLDYFMHYDPKTPAINFGYATIKEPLFEYAYIINNTNSAGTSFRNIGDITDVMAKSMFLPTNEMGAAIDSPFDNISNMKLGGAYDVLNKKAWAASASSAELIYDRQAVGRVYAYRTIQQLCTSMLQSPVDGSVDANRFFDDPDVLIRENEGKDNVIDALLSPGIDYMLNIDENTTQTDIDFYLDYHCNEQNLANKKDGLNDNLYKKLNLAKKSLDEYLTEIMSRQQGKVDAAIKFIKALQNISAICKNEMETESKDYANKNQIPVQWDGLLNSIKNKGIIGAFRPINNDAVEILQKKLTEVVTNHLEEIRRNWALQFYNKFEVTLNEKLQDLQGLKSELKKIADRSTNILLEEQQNALAISNFQIFLHKKDISIASQFLIDDTIKANFVTYLKEGIKPWIGQTEDYIEKQLWGFAKGTPKVKEAVNTDIDGVLRALPEDEVIGYLDHLKLLASPLWTYNTQGYSATAQELDKFVVVGVGNRDNSILRTNPVYSSFFEYKKNQPSFASTNQNDRVYVLMVEDLLPIYAVNNFKAYEYDHNEKVAKNYGMDNFIDEKLNNRMNSESFSVIPVVEKDNVLWLWVMGFVFDLIHYDEREGTYWISSKLKGDPLKDFRYNLNKQRDVAYDLFKSEQFYKEIGEAMNAKIARTGREPVDSKIDEIKRNKTYLAEVSQLSKWEKDNLYEPKFKAVRELLEQEVRLMTY